MIQTANKNEQSLVYKAVIGIDQLPVPATRWQHGFRICFATFILRKFTKLIITQQPLQLAKKISTDLE